MTNEFGVKRPTMVGGSSPTPVKIVDLGFDICIYIYISQVVPEPDFSENSPGADPCDQQSSRSSWIRSATGGETQGAATTAMAMGGYLLVM